MGGGCPAEDRRRRSNEESKTAQATVAIVPVWNWVTYRSSLLNTFAGSSSSIA
jgi:hypothetical protein